MVEIDFTCMEVVIPRVKFIEPMGYEMSVEVIEGFVQIILHSKVDSECPRWETYVEKMKEVQSILMEKDTKKKVDKVIESILKESSMSRKEFNEVKGVALEMKVSGQIDIITPTPIIVVGPIEQVTIAQSSVQAPVVPYAAIVQQ